MNKPCSFWFSFVLLVVFMVTTLSMQCGATNEERQVYIVYMGSLPEGEYSPSSHHNSILSNILNNSLVSDSLVRSYKRSFNGFAARLTNRERQILASMNGVVSVFPSRTLQLHTTRSWEFIGFSETVKRQATIESDVIVGVLDSGIWPESESFTDKGFGPPPKKWKGVCKGGKDFACNNKIIGARFYNSIESANETARDIIGHGSHTASTAAGNLVRNSSFYGFAQGTARGGVPSARIAVYKVCSTNGCKDEDMLAAYDDAIADGVDIITISIGPGYALPLTDDAVGIGAFHAMERGILTMNSAGNSGPQLGTVTSLAPWIFSIAASTIDRQFIDRVVLGNGKTLIGTSINSFTLPGKKLPLVYGKKVTSKCNEFGGRICMDGCLDSKLVKGKIVLCNRMYGKKEALRAGALAVIGQIDAEDDMQNDVTFVEPLPAAGLTAQDFYTVLSYINSTKAPKAKILKSEEVKGLSAPTVASFSSRGPNTIIPEIVKPDISAPGVEILAAFSPFASPSEEPLDKRSVKYSIVSGTSMSCPHAAGAAAYVKTFHPDWSPSVIKSALMTTASRMKSTYDTFGEFGYGSGHIDPIKALQPGLVYETFKDDYVKMLCSMGLDATAVRLIAGPNNTCHGITNTTSSPKDLNYPSMGAKVVAEIPFKIKFPRTVTNVGHANSTYKVTITKSSHIHVKVKPSVLSFKALNEKKSFVVTVSGKLPGIAAASLVWSDGTHSVHSPVVLHTNLESSIGF